MQAARTDLEVKSGVVTAWQALFDAPKVWSDLGKIPQLKTISVTQEFREGQKQAEHVISIKIRNLLVMRPSVLNLSGGKEWLEADVFVSLAGWSKEDLIVKTAAADTNVPFEIVESSRNSVKLRFQRNDLSKLLANEKSVKVGLNVQNVFYNWEILK